MFLCKKFQDIIYVGKTLDLVLREKFFREIQYVYYIKIYHVYVYYIRNTFFIVKISFKCNNYDFCKNLNIF